MHGARCVTGDLLQTGRSQNAAPHKRRSPRALNRALILSTLGINYTTNPQWAKAVFDAADKRSVDVVFENVGAATWKDSIGSLKRGGRLVTCGSTSGPDGETLIALVFWKQVHIIGSTMANRREFNNVMRLFFAGRLKGDPRRGGPAQGRRGGVGAAGRGQAVRPDRAHALAIRWRVVLSCAVL